MIERSACVTANGSVTLHGTAQRGAVVRQTEPLISNEKISSFQPDK